MFLILHQRREQRKVINVAVSNNQIKVFVNGKSVPFSGIPTQIRPGQETLQRAANILDRALVTLDPSTSGLIFRTDMTRMRGGWLPTGTEYDKSPIEAITERDIWTSLTIFGLAGAAISSSVIGLAGTAGIALFGFLATTSGVHLLEDFVKTVASNSAEVASMTANAKQEIHRINPQLQTGTLTVDFIPLKNAFHSPALTPSYLDIILRPANSKLQSIPLNPGESFAGTRITNRDYLYYSITKMVESVLDKTKHLPLQDREQAQQGLELLLGLFAKANPVLEKGAMPFSQISQDLLKGHAALQTIEVNSSAAPTSFNINTIKNISSGITSAASLVVSLASLGVNFLVLRGVKKISCKLDVIRAEQRTYYDGVLKAISDSQGAIIQKIVEAFAELKEDITDLKRCVEAGFQRIDEQLIRIESLIRSSSLALNMSNFIDISAKIEMTAVIALSQDQYSNMQLGIMPWVTKHCSSSLLTLSTINASTYNDQDTCALFNDRPLAECIGFLGRFYNSSQLDTANRISVETVPDIFVYTQAVTAFFGLYEQHSQYNTVVFREAGWSVVISKMMQPGIQAWGFIKKIQADANFWINKLIKPYRESAQEALRNYQGVSLPVDTLNRISACYLLLRAFVDLAFNFSLENDPLLQLLFSNGIKKELRLLSGNDIVADVGNRENITTLRQCLNEWLMNIDLAEAIILQYSKEIREQTSQQCHTVLMLSLSRLNQFATDRRAPIGSTVNLPEPEKFSFPKPAAFYLRNNLFHMVRVGNKELLTQCLSSQGVNIYQTNAIGETPLQYAVRLRDEQVAQLLRENGASSIDYTQPPTAESILTTERIMGLPDSYEFHVPLLPQRQLITSFFLAHSTLMRLWDASKPGMPIEINKWDITHGTAVAVSPNGKICVVNINSSRAGCKFEIFHLDSNDKRFPLSDTAHRNNAPPAVFDEYVIFDGTNYQVFKASNGEAVHSAIGENIDLGAGKFYRIENDGCLKILEKDPRQPANLLDRTITGNKQGIVIRNKSGVQLAEINSALIGVAEHRNIMFHGQLLSERYVLVSVCGAAASANGAPPPTVWDYSAHPPRRLYSLNVPQPGQHHSTYSIVLPHGDIMTFGLGGGNVFHEFKRS